VSREQIDTVIEIARHIRDERTKTRRKTRRGLRWPLPRAADRLAAIAVSESGTCCTPTPSGKSCC
jgi:hypothetical protein